MKLVKTYAWEDAFIEKIGIVRSKEVALYFKQTIGKAILIASVFVMPPTFVAVIFGVYEISNEVS
jgi:hypothetical protein